PVRAHLDVEVAGVGFLALASRAGVLHDEALDLTRRAEIHLNEVRPLLGAPAVGFSARDAAVDSLLRSPIGTAGNTSCGGTAERQILRPVDSVDLELINPGDLIVVVVGRAADVQADETRFDGRLDQVGGRAAAAATLPG